MPTYDYECKSCGYNFEFFQSIMDPPLTKCPQCGKAVRRLIGGGTGIIFKGSGFYVTDNRGSNGKKAGAGKSESKNESSKTDGSGADGSKADGSGADGSKAASSKAEGSSSATASESTTSSGKSKPETTGAGKSTK